jgi:hypothetical protein
VTTRRNAPHIAFVRQRLAACGLASLGAAAFLATLSTSSYAETEATPNTEPAANEGGPVTIHPEVGHDMEMSWDRGTARLSAFGAVSKPAPETDQRFSEALLDARVSLPIYSRLHLNVREKDFDGIFVLGHVGAAGYTLNPEFAEGADRYYRMSAGGSVAWLNSWPALLTLYAGARVAESENTLSDPELRPLVLALAAHRLARGFVLIYGAGFTYHLGRALPLPFVGVAWEFQPDWSLVTLLPASAYLQYRASGKWQFSGGIALDGDTYGYQAMDAEGEPQRRTLGVTRLKFLTRLAYGAHRDPQIRFDLGLQRTRVDPNRGNDDDDGATFGGLFSRAVLVVPWGE